MANPSSVVSCSVECYPLEGGPYYIDGGQIRSVTVSKSLRGGQDGRFTIELAPGGPFGTESAPDWIEVITPGSHVLIGMQRGGEAAIVLDGVATSTTERQVWSSNAEGSSASRNQVVSGSDLAWFFNTQNWYSLAMYGLTAGTNIGGQLGYLPTGLVPLLSQGLVGNGSPAKIGDVWFNKIMAGNGGVLGETFVPYHGGYSRLPFNTLVAENIEQYPGVYVPYTEQFMGLESWMAKFLDIFPWPWYEFFVTTAPSGFYSFVNQPSGPPNIVATGVSFTMQSMPDAAPAGTQMVARVNPVPRMDFAQIGTEQRYVPTTVDMTRWNALPLTTLADTGFYESNIRFSSDEARNFYLINPTAYSTLYGSNGANVVPFAFIYAGAADPASIHRYGYRPADATLRWFWDVDGDAAQNPNLNIAQSVATLTAALASWWHPLPLMATAEVSVPLAPKIYIGTRYRYAPFKDGVPWDFYVEGVSHRFVFGGQSSTTLSLTRGLPTSVYADSSAAGVLQAIYTGNARRQYVQGQPGLYQIDLPSGTGQGLQVFSSPAAAGTLAQQMWTGFATPQVAGSGSVP